MYGLDTPDKLTLKQMQAYVKTDIVELVYCLDGREMLVDEEGLMKELELNPEASLLVGRPLVGNALILDYRMD